MLEHRVLGTQIAEIGGHGNLLHTKMGSLVCHFASSLVEVDLSARLVVVAILLLPIDFGRDQWARQNHSEKPRQSAGCVGLMHWRSHFDHD